MIVVRESEYTKVEAIDEPGNGGAYHEYAFGGKDLGAVFGLGGVKFQCGPIQENGVNGIQNEDLLAVVIHRLQCFNAGPYACRENAIAITKCQEALMWLEKRTADRKARGVEGTSEK